MPGETDLTKLLAAMAPDLRPGVFAFATLPPGAQRPAGIDPIMIFREREGETLIVPEGEAAQAGIASTFRSRMITLDVHSALDAVGFLAFITARLAAAGMGVNPVSGYFHDHLFVPADRADEAMGILRAIAAENG